MDRFKGDQLIPEDTLIPLAGRTGDYQYWGRRAEEMFRCIPECNGCATDVSWVHVSPRVERTREHRASVECTESRQRPGHDQRLLETPFCFQSMIRHIRIVIRCDVSARFHVVKPIRTSQDHTGSEYLAVYSLVSFRKYSTVPAIFKRCHVMFFLRRVRHAYFTNRIS